MLLWFGRAILSGAPETKLFCLSPVTVPPYMRTELFFRHRRVEQQAVGGILAEKLHVSGVIRPIDRDAILNSAINHLILRYLRDAAGQHVPRKKSSIHAGLHYTAGLRDIFCNILYARYTWLQFVTFGYIFVSVFLFSLYMYKTVPRVPQSRTRQKMAVLCGFLRGTKRGAMSRRAAKTVNRRPAIPREIHYLPAVSLQHIPFGHH